ncbi:hypothetical protein HK102_012552, partial [Quaeritorhiza haematococci]
MRKHLLQDFTRIYHLDLHGNVRQNPKLSGTTHNVFGIQVGVGITVAVKSSKHKDRCIFYYRVPETWKKEQKLSWVSERKSISGVEWDQLRPDGRNSWLATENAALYSSFMPSVGSSEARKLGSSEARKLGSSEAEHSIFQSSSLGIATNRDEWLYDFSTSTLKEKVSRHIHNYNFEVFRLSQESERPENIDGYINRDDAFIKWTDRLKSSLIGGRTLKYQDALVQKAVTRPFVRKMVYFDDLLVHRRYQQHRIFPAADTVNRAIA